MSLLFSPEFKDEPYWWDASAPWNSAPDAVLPTDVDVAIIGSGYTGLQAAVQTARAGLSTVVLDAEFAGWGCSTRNGGQISTSVKLSWSVLAKRYGEATATAIRTEAQASLEYIQRFIRDETISCSLHASGRFHGAHSARAYDKLHLEVDTKHPGDRIEAYLIPPEEITAELGTCAYYGGIVYPHHASLDPGRYHAGLLGIAQSAGASVRTQCRVHNYEKVTGGFRLSTSKGGMRAQKLIIATNGHTGKLTPWLQRRVIPIGSYIIATEEIPATLMQQLMPTNRVLSDTRKLVCYYRPSPDRKRILFGGRVSLSESDPRITGPKLHREMVKIFPELRNVRISHSWAGYVAYTFDTTMHAGEQDGVYHATGYCGSGVGMASYLGMRIGQQVAYPDEARSAFAAIPFPTRPLYTGNPWFLAPSIMAYRLMDRLS